MARVSRDGFVHCLPEQLPESATAAAAAAAALQGRHNAGNSIDVNTGRLTGAVSGLAVLVVV